MYDIRKDFQGTLLPTAPPTKCETNAKAKKGKIVCVYPQNTLIICVVKSSNKNIFKHILCYNTQQLNIRLNSYRVMFIFKAEVFNVCMFDELYMSFFSFYFEHAFLLLLFIFIHLLF